MATRAEGLTGFPALATPPPAAPSAAEVATLRVRRELKPGLVLAFFYAWTLSMARLIDVSEDGIAMLVFGLTFAVVVAFAAAMRPRWYLPLVLAYLPFSKAYPLPIAGIGGANMTNFLLALGVVAWISRRSQSRVRLRIGPTELLVVAFVAVASLSVLAVDTGEGLGDTLQTYRGWIAPMLFFFLARGLVRDREDIRGLLEVLAWTTFLVAADTWKEGIDRGSRGSIDRARVPGLMVQANSMGAFLVYYGVPLLALAVTARPWKRSLPYLLGFLFAARATLFTFSRGAYLAMAAGSATVMLFANPLVLAVAGGGGVAAVTLVPSLLPDSVRERLEETTTGETIYEGENASPTLDRSSAHRLVLWRGAVRMIAERPVFGVGLGRFQQNIAMYTEYPLRQTDPHDAHNAYLLQAAEMGVPSLLLLLLLFVVWGMTSLRLWFRRRHPVDRRLALLFLGSLAGVVVSCMLGSRFSDEALVGPFWMLAAMIVVVARLRPRRRRRPA